MKPCKRTSRKEGVEFAISKVDLRRSASEVVAASRVTVGHTPTHTHIHTHTHTLTHTLRRSILLGIFEIASAHTHFYCLPLFYPPCYCPTKYIYYGVGHRENLCKFLKIDTIFVCGQSFSVTCIESFNYRTLREQI